MARNSELNVLRAKVRTQHRNANAKASRLRAKGVEIGGTRYDPRRNLGNVKKYTKKQLESYSASLSNFTSRNNGFERGQGGTPLSSSGVKAYRRTERAFNKRAESEYSRVADIAIPGRGMTVRQADMVDRPTNRLRAGGETVSRPFDIVKRNIMNVTGDKALNRLTKQLADKLKPQFKPKALRAQRAQFMDMLTTIGNIEQVNSAKELSDEQFNVLFNYHTELVNEISMDYEFTKMRATGTQEKFMERIHEDATDRINSTLKWAKTLDL